MADSERTAMLWPKGLKQQVQERVGPKGTVTSFTLEAVQEKLDREAAPDPGLVVEEITRTEEVDDGLTDIGSPMGEPPTDAQMLDGVRATVTTEDGQTRILAPVTQEFDTDRPISGQIAERIAAGQSRVDAVKDEFGLKSASEITPGDRVVPGDLQFTEPSESMHVEAATESDFDEAPGEILQPTAERGRCEVVNAEGLRCIRWDDHIEEFGQGQEHEFREDVIDVPADAPSGEAFKAIVDAPEGSTIVVPSDGSVEIIPPPEVAVEEAPPLTNVCPDCFSPLIDGECWSCSI